MVSQVQRDRTVTAKISRVHQGFTVKEEYVGSVELKVILDLQAELGRRVIGENMGREVQ